MLSVIESLHSLLTASFIFCPHSLSLCPGRMTSTNIVTSVPSPSDQEEALIGNQITRRERGWGIITSILSQVSGRLAGAMFLCSGPIRLPLTHGYSSPQLPAAASSLCLGWPHGGKSFQPLLVSEGFTNPQ